MKVEAIETAIRQHYRDHYMFYQGKFSCTWAIVGYAAMWLSHAMYRLDLFIKSRQHNELTQADELVLLRILTTHQLLTYPAFKELAEMITLPTKDYVHDAEQRPKPVSRLHKLILKKTELYTLDNLRDISEFEFAFNEKVVRRLELLGEKGLNQIVLTHIFNLCRQYPTHRQAALVAVMDYCDDYALNFMMKNKSQFFKTPARPSATEDMLTKCHVM
jgi:hypothetical protein